MEKLPTHNGFTKVQFFLDFGLEIKDYYVPKQKINNFDSCC